MIEPSDQSERVRFGINIDRHYASLAKNTNPKSPHKLWKWIFLSIICIAVLLIVLYIAAGIISDRVWGNRADNSGEESAKVQALETELKKVNGELQRLKDQFASNIQREKNKRQEEQLRQEIVEEQKKLYALQTEAKDVNGKLQKQKQQLKQHKLQERSQEQLKKNIIQEQKKVETLQSVVKQLNRKLAKLQWNSSNHSNKTFVDNPGVVIDVPYPAGDYFPLPVDFRRKNSDGKTLNEFLYPVNTPDFVKWLKQFQDTRVSIVNSKIGEFPQLSLAKYNNAVDEAFQKEGISANEKDWERLNAKFGLDKLTTELPMCIVVPSFNNNIHFRIEQNLNSIFSQNYTNYRVVVIDDLSSDNSNEIYQKYFAFHRIDKQRYVYIENSQRATTLPNLYLGSMNHCPLDSVVINIDGDDELIGRNQLKIFNWGYQTKKAGVMYTNFIRYGPNNQMHYGFTSEYTDDEKKNNLYKSAPMRFSHLRSYRNELLFQIDPKDFQFDNGEWYAIFADIALFFPIMEVACGRVHKIEGEYSLLYNYQTGLNDASKPAPLMAKTHASIIGKKKNVCYEDFNKRMSA